MMNTIYPVKCNFKRVRIEPGMPDFRCVVERALPAHRADWWDWSHLPFSERVVLLATLACPCRHLRFTLAGSTGTKLTIPSGYYTINCLGFDTVLVSSGVVPVALQLLGMGNRNPLIADGTGVSPFALIGLYFTNIGEQILLLLVHFCRPFFLLTSWVGEGKTSNCCHCRKAVNVSFWGTILAPEMKVLQCFQLCKVHIFTPSPLSLVWTIPSTATSAHK